MVKKRHGNPPFLTGSCLWITGTIIARNASGSHERFEMVTFVMKEYDGIHYVTEQNSGMLSIGKGGLGL